VSVLLNELETRAAQLGYHFDGVVRVEHPFAEEANQVTWTVVLVDSEGSELTFQADSIPAAVELATDRMTFLSGMIDL
jgi:hypothetical protein